MTSNGTWNEIATTGEHVKLGQTSYEAILSEASEELGINISNDNVKKVDSYIFGFAFIDVYYLKKDIEINDLELQYEEVE